MPGTQRSTPKMARPELDAYRAKGYVVVRGRFEPRQEPARWAKECDRLFGLADVVRAENPRIQARGHVSAGSVLDRFDPVIDLSPVFQRLTEDPRVLEAAGAVLGSAATLLKDKLIAKRPGTRGYGMHQDFPYWDGIAVPADALVTVCIAIDPAAAESGAIEVFPGLHGSRLPGTPEEPRDVDEAALDLSTGELAVLQPGDMLLLHPLAPHRSSPNTSERSRRTLFYTYARAEYGDVYRRYYARKHADQSFR